MIQEHFAALREAVGRLEAEGIAGTTLRRWGHHLAGVLDAGGRLLACGNGGSAAEAQHLTGELTGRLCHDRRPYAALALHTDTSAVTAIVNDYGPREVFARQVRAHGQPGDVLIALSTSGRSENVLAAAEAARAARMTVWALTGPAPNGLLLHCHEAIAVDAPTVMTVQEVHLVLVHALCAAVDEALGVTGPVGRGEEARP